MSNARHERRSGRRGRGLACIAVALAVAAPATAAAQGWGAETRRVESRTERCALDGGAAAAAALLEDAPAWTDRRYESKAGRKAIVREAAAIAFGKLWWTHDESNLHLVFDAPFGARNFNAMRSRMRFPDGSVRENGVFIDGNCCPMLTPLFTAHSVRAIGAVDVSAPDEHALKRRVRANLEPRGRISSTLANARRTVTVEVGYCGVTRGADEYARCVLQRTRITKPNPYDGGGIPPEVWDYMVPRYGMPDSEGSRNGVPVPDDQYPYWDSTCFVERPGAKSEYCREEWSFDVEINPEVFVRGRLLIPIPGAERWAESPVEAATFLILHEFGHIESFVGEHSSYNALNPRSERSGPRVRSEVGDSEDDAWVFAGHVYDANQP